MTSPASELPVSLICLSDRLTQWLNFCYLPVDPGNIQSNLSTIVFSLLGVAGICAILMALVCYFFIYRRLLTNKKLTKMLLLGGTEEGKYGDDVGMLDTSTDFNSSSLRDMIESSCGSGSGLPQLVWRLDFIFKWSYKYSIIYYRSNAQLLAS